MTHLEDDNMFFPIVFFDKVHIFVALKILVCVVILAIEPLHHVFFKVLDKIYLCL